ncbi:hypothetical protein THAOC_17027, partial [Thalassiosira oceanica]
RSQAGAAGGRGGRDRGTGRGHAGVLGAEDTRARRRLHRHGGRAGREPHGRDGDPGDAVRDQVHGEGPGDRAGADPSSREGQRIPRTLRAGPEHGPEDGRGDGRAGGPAAGEERLQHHGDGDAARGPRPRHVQVR